MKKLILAPAVALALAGLIAAPVNASETPADDPQQQSQVENAPAEPASAKDDDSTADGEGSDVDTDAGAETDSGADTAAEADSADDGEHEAGVKGGDSETGTDAETSGSADGGEAEAEASDDADGASDPDASDPSDPITSTVTIEDPELTAEEFVEIGAVVTVTDLKTTDTVTDSLNNQPRQPFEDGDQIYQITYPGDVSELTPGETVDFTMTITRPEVGEQVYPVAVTIVEEEENELGVSLEVVPDKITAEDLADESKGMMIRVSGVETGDTVTDSLTEETESVTEDGTYTKSIYYQGDPDDLEVGQVDFNVVVTRGEGEELQEEILYGSIEIVEDDAEQDAHLQVGQNRITVSELSEYGLPYTGTGFTPGAEALALALPNDSEQEIYYEEITVADDGTVEGAITLNTEFDVDLGDYTLYVMDEDNLAEAAFAVVADEAPDASLSISPKVIEAADFVNEKKGVTLTVKNCYPGSAVSFTVTAENSDITAYENVVTVNEDGTAAVTVYGTTANPSAYVGKYDVEAACEDIDILGGSFEVIAGAAGGGGGGAGGGNGSDLPRTGIDLAGLGAGALLLLVGGAAVAITARRKGQNRL